MIPGLAMLRGYQRSWLRGDLVAGVTVAAYLVPQVMAYAAVAGLPPVAGLWAALPALVIYAVLGSSPSLSMGPESTTALMTAIAIGPLAAGEPARYAALAATLALLVGLMSLAAWLLRLGFVADLLSRPVLVGYMAGVALIMIAGQLARVTGVPVTGQSLPRAGHLLCPRRRAGSSWRPSWSRRRSWPSSSSSGPGGRKHPARCWPCCWPPLPWRCSASAAAASVSSARSRRACRSRGYRPFDLHDLRELLLPAFSVLIVAFSDDVLTARSFARRGEEIRPNQELLALGVANVGSSLLRGFPVSSSASRTAIGVAAGSRTQLYSLAAAASVLAVLLFARPVLAHFPTAALGAIVIYAAVQADRRPSVPAAARLPPQRDRRSPCRPALACSPSIFFTASCSRSPCR